MPLHGFGKIDDLVYMARDLARPKARRPAQTGRMTLKKLEALIKAGYGEGHGHRYKPWLRVTKHDYSPYSLIGHLPVPEQKRLQHFRAESERRVLLLVRWLGGDARDAYPFWPWPHAHPLVGLPGICDLPGVRGLTEIAKDACINHGNYIGTNLPYVATIDILATWQTRSGYVLVAYDCKPEELVKACPPGARLHQRILLHRRYCAETRIQFRLTHAETLPRFLMVNLHALYPLLGPGELEALRRSDDYRRVVETMASTAYNMPAFDALKRAAARHGVDLKRAQLILDSALWTQDLDHDLRDPLEMYEPLLPGGRKLKAALLREWAPPGAVHV